MFASLAAYAGLEIKDVATRSLRFVLLLGLALVMAFAALFYGLGAVRTQLAMSIGVIDADLAIAAGLAFTGALLAGAAFLARRKTRRSRVAQTAAIVATPVALKTLAALAPHLLRAAPVAIVGGFLLGRLLAGDKED